MTSEPAPSIAHTEYAKAKPAMITSRVSLPISKRARSVMNILRIVEEDGYDLTAIGAGSTRWLGRLLLGSVSIRVLHASPTSVLVATRHPEV